MSGLVFDFCETSRVIQEIPPDERPVQSMNGWPYSPRPRTPYQRTFKVQLHGMYWYLLSQGINTFPGLVRPVMDIDPQLYVVDAGQYGQATTPSMTLIVQDIPTNFSPDYIDFGQPSETSVVLEATTVGNNVQTYNVGSVVSTKEYNIVMDVPSSGSGLKMSVGTPDDPDRFLVVSVPNGVTTYTFVAPGNFVDTIITFEPIGIGNPPFVINSVEFKQLGSLGLNEDYDPTHNAGRLLAFYRAHRTWDSFLLNHEYLGVMRVRFNKPVIVPEAVPGSNGFIDSFEVELIEHNPSYL